MGGLPSGGPGGFTSERRWGVPLVGLVLSQGRGAFLGSGLQAGPDDMVFTAKKWLHASLVWSLPNLDLRTCCGYQAPILGLFTPLPSGKGALVKWFLGHMPRLSYRLGKRQKEAVTLTLSQHPLSLSPHLPRLRQQEAPDLFQWLCSDSLKLCCPSGTFGPSCLRESSLEVGGDC